MLAILVHASPMAGLDDLTDDERAAMVTALRQTKPQPLSAVASAEVFQIGAGEARSRVVPKTRLSGRRRLTRAASS